MTKRIFRSIFLVATAVLAASLLLVMGVAYRAMTDAQRDRLAGQLALAAHGVEQGGAAYLDGLQTEGFRLTWLDANGAVLYDSKADPTSMQNHLDREEVREALATGVGESERASETLRERTLYRAERLGDGTVLRLSVTQATVLAMALGMVRPLLLLLLAAVLLSALLARRLARRVLQPLDDLDLDAPLENEAYEELSPLLTRIEKQQRQIRGQMEALRQKQDEFAAVTDSMGEGLVLLNAEGCVLSLNPAAMRLFGADEACVGRDWLTVERSVPMQRLLADALAGRHGEGVLPFAEGDTQIIVSPVRSAERVVGACLLAFDVSEREQAEQRRREFSANVSHELKTPLQSILGAAELLQNGMVKPEDVPRFAGRIHSEAARLVTLIEDIIRLSQLDEGGELPREPVELNTLAREAVDALAGEAQARQVAVEVTGAQATVSGVRRLLYEIVYNLCDNAIKYNREGGRVTVHTAWDGDGTLLTVADTGVGIPPEAQGRVFERFYRVDKSHSRAIGGTGLGLSIVKHAAQAHGARIELTSRVDQGTTVTVRFPGKEENV